MIRPFRGGSRLRRALAGAVVVTALAAGVPIALGQFSDAAAIGTNSFTTASCWSAVKSLQKGTATSAANGTVTVAISSVDMAKSFLLFNVRSNWNEPVGSIVNGRIATSTSLEFSRVTDETSTIQIQWYVVEYACGVNVQRGTTTLPATVNNVSITPVGSLSQAFVTWSKTAAAADTTMDGNDALVAELTTTSNLQFRINNAASAHAVWWQVVEFTSAADINVQKGTTTLAANVLSTTATIPTPVTLGQTFLLVSYQAQPAGANTDMGARMLRAELTNANTITFTRGTGGDGDPLSEIHWQAVQLTGSTVRRGVESFASAQAQRTVTIGAVDTSRSVAFASVAAPSGLSGGSTPYTGDDIPGVASFTTNLSSSTQLVLERSNTAAAADVGWFVVQLR